MNDSLGWKPIVAGLALFASGPVLADVKAGVDAWASGDYASAVKQWRGPAEQGDADAMFNLGQAYKLGRGVTRDLPKAEELFGRAAAQGHLQASDNYGLLLFQRGEQARAMPFIRAAAERGDPRAQYILGLAHFNGDFADKDWVRAYALVSLAQQTGLPQAAGALARMDEHIPLEQRQQSVALATEIAADAQAARSRQLATANLGGAPVRPTAPDRARSMGQPTITAPTAIPRMPSVVSAEQEIARGRPGDGAPVSGSTSSSPSGAGADYARPQLPRTAVIARPALPPRPVAKPKPVFTAAPARSAPLVTASGSWRVQLGAFGVPGNAEALWTKLKGRPELAGHTRLLVPAGKLTKLQAGGFASRDAADAACGRLKAGGFGCLPAQN